MYKVSKEIKWMFILNVLLFITGLILNADVAVMGSAIIGVVLAVSVEVLEAIHSTRKSK